MAKGWTNEFERHSLARQGIKTAVPKAKKQYFVKEPFGLPRELQPVNKFYTPREEEDLKVKNKKKAFEEMENLAVSEPNLSSNAVNDKVYSISKKFNVNEDSLKDYYNKRVLDMDKNEKNFQEKKSNLWHYEKDVYGDPSWDINKDGAYYELRVYPNKENWSAILVKFESKDLFAKKINQRTLSKGEKEEVIKYAEKYVKG